MQCIFVIFLSFFTIILGAKGRGWPTICDALHNYQSLYGDINLIPYKFRVPPAEPWPQSTHGLLLGQIVSRIRNRGDYPEVKKIFQIYSREDRLDIEFETFASALKYYQASTQEIAPSPPAGYILPSQPPVPSHLYGYQLGTRFGDFRLGKIFTSLEHASFLKDALIPGTVIKKGPKRARVDSKLLLSALEAFERVHGNIFVPHNYTIPIGDSAFPVKTHGMKLGHRVAHIRNRGSYASIRDKIDAIGLFPWVVTRDKEFLSILQSLLDQADDPIFADEP